MVIAGLPKTPRHPRFFLSGLKMFSFQCTTNLGTYKLGGSSLRAAGTRGTANIDLKSAA